jgi:hypothetical protein
MFGKSLQVVSEDLNVPRSAKHFAAPIFWIFKRPLTLTRYYGQMMDIATLKEGLIVSANRRKEGESYAELRLRQRVFSPRRMTLWRSVMRILRKYLIRVFSTALYLSEEDMIARIIFSCGGFLGIFLTDDFPTIKGGPLRIELPPQDEVNRDPPKYFVPIPDSEIGGCARSDSLIAPAI